MPVAVAWAVTLTIPYALLVLAGLLLWKRHRSAATTLIALGFAAVLIGQIVGYIESIAFSSIVRAHPDASFVVTHYHTGSRVIHLAAILGLWAGSLGLIWHARQHRS